MFEVVKGMGMVVECARQDAQLRVAPFYGEQPWMSAPRRSSLFPRWSMMTVVFETRRLLFHLSCCGLFVFCVFTLN